MFEELLVRHCSPTLAGIKTGNLFACSFACIENMRSAVRKVNSFFVKKGLRVLPLRFQDNKALIYVYRPSKLLLDLKHNISSRLLRESSYKTDSPKRCIVYLIHRIASSRDFPHEIGLFLRYPPEDVCGFIENKAENWKCAGLWKVYGDAEAAKRLFEQYKKCTECYCALFAKGRSIKQLAVAV